jgi:hypothetical protein
MRYDRTLVLIRERSFLDLLDLAMVVIRERPFVLALAAAVGIAPWAALNVWLLSDPEFSRFYWGILLILETPFATAPLTLVLGELMFDRPPRLGRMARTLLASLPAMIATQLFVRGILLGTVVGYLAMPAQYSFLDEVILLERLGVGRTLARSRDLASGFEGELFIRWLGQLFLGMIFSLCFWASTETLSSALFGNEYTWYRPGLSDMSGVLFQAAVWIAIAYFGVFRFFAYIDRRIRLEGWELDLRLKAVNRGLEERSM